MKLFGKTPVMPSPADVLPGREDKIVVSENHYVNGHRVLPPFSDNFSITLFGLGCFWGAERKFWELSGVYSTSVGYSAGYTPNPSYQEVCSGLTGHNEVVQVVYDEKHISYYQLLKCFWESHNSTQGMQQGNDVGTQYRSGIYYFSNAQKCAAEKSRDLYQAAISQLTDKIITTEIIAATEFYYAEDYHQQYLAKNVNGYCGLGGSGVLFPENLMEENINE